MAKLGRARRSRQKRIADRHARERFIRDWRAAQELERLRFWERLAAEPPAEH